MGPVPDKISGMTLLSGRDIFSFLTAGPIFVFDPDTLAAVASVTYLTDGCVRMTTEGGEIDDGVWGVEGAVYWTQYSTFRSGQRHEFFLEIIAADTMQAHFSNGERAFLQSHKRSLKSGP